MTPFDTPARGVAVADLAGELELARAELDGVRAANDQVWARARRAEALVGELVEALERHVPGGCEGCFDACTDLIARARAAGVS